MLRYLSLSLEILWAVLQFAQCRGSKTCVVLVADYNDEKGVRQINDTVHRLASNCQVHVVAKGSVKCDVYEEKTGQFSCEERNNVGREFGTVTTWISENYDILPDILVLSPSSVGTWNRVEKLDKLLKAWDAGGFDCAVEMSPASQVIRDGNGLPIIEPAEEAGQAKKPSRLALQIQSVGNMKKEKYSKSARPSNLQPANPRGLLKWLEHYTCSSDCTTSQVSEYDNALICTNGIFRTTRALLQKWPQGKRFYTDLSLALNVSNAPEAGHYAELVARVLFGDPKSIDGTLGPLAEASSPQTSAPNSTLTLVLVGLIAALVAAGIGFYLGQARAQRAANAPLIKQTEMRAVSVMS